MAYANWFSRTTSGYDTWAALTAEATEATIDGTAELPPYALLAQAEIEVTTSAVLSASQPPTHDYYISAEVVYNLSKSGSYEASTSATGAITASVTPSVAAVTSATVTALLTATTEYDIAIVYGYTASTSLAISASVDYAIDITNAIVNKTLTNVYKLSAVSSSSYRVKQGLGKVVWSRRKKRYMVVATSA